MRTGDDVYCPVCATEAVVSAVWDPGRGNWAESAVPTGVHLYGVRLSCWCQFFPDDRWTADRDDDGVWRLFMTRRPERSGGKPGYCLNCPVSVCGRQDRACADCGYFIPWAVCPHCAQVAVMRFALVPWEVHPHISVHVGWYPDCCGQWLPRPEARSSGWLIGPGTGHVAGVRRVQHLSVFRVGEHEQDGPVYLDGVDG